MTNERLLEILSDRQTCDFCPDAGDAEVCVQCKLVKGIRCDELRDYYHILREMALARVEQ